MIELACGPAGRRVYAEFIENVFGEHAREILRADEVKPVLIGALDRFRAEDGGPSSAEPLHVVAVKAAVGEMPLVAAGFTMFEESMPSAAFGLGTVPSHLTSAHAEGR